MNKLDTMMKSLSFEDEILEALKEMKAAGLVGSYFDEESGEMMWYSKEKLH